MSKFKDWVCPECSELNDGDDAECSDCGTDNPDPELDD